MKKLMRYFLIWTASLLMVGMLNAQEEDQIKGTNIHYEPGDWVSYSMTRFVRSMAMGREFVYFATTGGVTRYNYFSNRWDEPFTMSDGMADNYVITVAYDMNTDYFWCSTHAGVSLYRTTFRRWENYFKKELGLSQDEDVLSIGFDDFYVWLETNSGRFLKGSNQQAVFEKVPSSDVPVNKIKWYGRRVSNLGNLPHLMMNDGYFFDTDGYIRDHRLNNYDVTCYMRDRWSTIWVGSWGVGIGKADARIEILELIPFGLFKENVTAAKMDNEYNIWMGGFGYHGEESGITFWDSENNEWNYFQARFLNDLKSDQISSIVIDEPYVWFGTEFGVAYFNRDKYEWRTFDTGSGLRDNYVYDVETDGENVWIGTERGLSKLVKKDMREKDFRITDVVPQDIRSMAVYDVQLMNNLLWIGTEFGLYVYDMLEEDGGFENEPNGPQNKVITAVECYQDKEVWVGLQDGIEVFDMEKQEWLGAPEKRFYESRDINFLKADDFSVWAATNSGVLRFDRERKRWIQFTTRDGLISNNVNCIILDGDYVWFGTDMGLTKFFWNDPYRID